MIVRRVRSQARQGKVAVMAAIMMVPLAGMVAFSMDLGHIGYVRNELHNAADAAALAGAMRLRGAEAQRLSWMTKAAYYRGDNDIRREAERIVEQNDGGGVDLVADRNVGNLTTGDIVIGYINVRNPGAPMTYSGPLWNSVRVTTYRNATHSGKLSLFFAPVLGRADQEVTATATATLTSDPWGSVLPIAVFLDDYNALFDSRLDKEETDYFTYNPDLAPLGSDNYSNRVIGGFNSPVPDGVRELRIFPDKNNTPGNFGTVDFGHLSGSTADIVRQIHTGISEADRVQMALLGQLDADGRLVANPLLKLTISGDTGVSWTIEKDLYDIIGQTRTIPVYESVILPGNNALYTIVGFVNVVVVESGNLQAGNKTIRIQPIAPYTIFDSPDQNMLGHSIVLTR